MANLLERLKAVRHNPNLSRVPTISGVQGIVTKAINEDLRLSEDDKLSFSLSWNTARAYIPPDKIQEYIATDRKNWDRVKATFDQCDKGKHGPLMHDELHPFYPWTPGDDIVVMNWPPKSKSATQPNLPLFHDLNRSHCSFFLEMEGLRDYAIMDHSPCRWDNSLTGQDPNEQMSDDFLDSCDDWILFRILITLAYGASGLMLSSWLRDRILALKDTKFRAAFYPINAHIPFTSQDTIPGTFWFVIPEDFPAYKGSPGKLMFKKSLGSLDKPSSILQLALNDVMLNLFRAATTPGFSFESVRLVSTIWGMLGANDHHWFWCELGNVGKRERDLEICFKDRHDLQMNGVSYAFYVRLQLYRYNNAVEIDTIKSKLPILFMHSMVQPAAALMQERREAANAEMRDINDADGKALYNKDGSPAQGDMYLQRSIKLCKMYHVKTETGKMRYHRDGSPFLGTKLGEKRLAERDAKQAVKQAARRAANAALRGLTDFEGNALYNEDDTQLQGNERQQRAIKSWKLYHLRTANGEPRYKADGSPVIGTAKREAKLNKLAQPRSQEDTDPSDEPDFSAIEDDAPAPTGPVAVPTILINDADIEEVVPSSLPQLGFFSVKPLFVDVTAHAFTWPAPVIESGDDSGDETDTDETETE